MASGSSTATAAPNETSTAAAETPRPGVDVQVALLTGGFDRPYVYGFVAALAEQRVGQEVIAGDELDGTEMHSTPGLKFFNFLPRKASEKGWEKLSRILRYYARLIRYAANAKPKIFHILWNNKFELFDRTLLMLYYRFSGKKIVFTAHNVNAGKRDGNDSFLNRLTLRIQYRLSDHIFVHTERMKSELRQELGVREASVTVIPFGINNSVPGTDLTSADARQRLGLGSGEKVILFFGALRRYKGLEYLVRGFLKLAEAHPECRLIVAGQQRKEDAGYAEEIQRAAAKDRNYDKIIWAMRYIAEEEIEAYFKAADVLALPYTHVFQSGVLFLAYNFGLPVVATDVGAVRDEVIEGKTGFLCRPCDADDLARALEAYFESSLFPQREIQRREISEWASARHSWSIVAEKTRSVYERLLAN